MRRSRALSLALAAAGAAHVGCGSDGGAVIPDGAADRPPAGSVVAAGVRWFGRVDTTTDSEHPRFAWSGTGFAARFSGTGLSATLSGGYPFIFKAVVDGTPQPTFTITTGSGTYPLATGLAAGEHTVALYRQTEGAQGTSQLMGLTVEGGVLLDPPPAPARLIEVIGDSISAGYGALGTVADTDCFATESHWDSYAAVMGRALGADVSTIAASGRGVIRNYPGDAVDTVPLIYGRTLTNEPAPAWDFRHQPQVVVINLGTNDISNDKGDPGTPFEDTYRTLLETVRASYPSAFIICIIGPLLGDGDLVTIEGHIRTAVAARKAAGDGRVELFDEIAPQTSDKAACESHPNPAENQLMADLVVAEISARLGW